MESFEVPTTMSAQSARIPTKVWPMSLLVMIQQLWWELMKTKLYLFLEVKMLAWQYKMLQLLEHEQLPGP
jgi:hypothetical protein